MPVIIYNLLRSKALAIKGNAQTRPDSNSNSDRDFELDCDWKWDLHSSADCLAHEFLKWPCSPTRIQYSYLDLESFTFTFMFRVPPIHVPCCSMFAWV